MSPSRDSIGDLERQILIQGIQYLLVQFVDIHGAAKVKMVPSGELWPAAGEVIRLKREEWREYHAQVEAWEVRRYLTAL